MKRVVSITALLLLLFAAQACASTDDALRTWAFRVALDERAIGTHRFTLRHSEDGTQVISEVDLRVPFLFFTAYRYTHRADERWNGNCLVALRAVTDDNGRQQSVEASLVDTRLVVTRDAGTETLNVCVMSFAYWNPAILGATRLLNPQTGEYQSVTITRAGEETITVRDTATAATRYALRAPQLDIDLWYSPDGDWLALESSTEGGRLRYHLE